MLPMLLLLLSSLAQATPVTLVLGEWQRATLGSSNVQTRVDLPGGTRRVWIQFVLNAGMITHTGSDGGSLGSHYGTFSANSWIDMRPQCAQAYKDHVPNAGCSIYLSSATGSTVVELYATSADS